jgi:hypothetical protein
LRDPAGGAAGAARAAAVALVEADGPLVEVARSRGVPIGR